MDCSVASSRSLAFSKATEIIPSRHPFCEPKKYENIQLLDNLAAARLSSR
ncbi:predicted protein [Sclerotinia sclerotiorum 1980 UF-70]|uniref:Uncharacterized protein n=1 Tax=Sclerotinia sclerotiorum (strain ATCC 18683 / 1980 / Ss-1) TaxID=665079 RepID=A7EJI0_SCLS1|nr:predicted protein [Sclerotinia sclerotiorum 1980 UF-70]EDO02996.1 predicted protein [Sclerotinia sclerotiorum 1980 UF-70]